jgi:hypothetical protein
MTSRSGGASALACQYSGWRLRSQNLGVERTRYRGGDGVFFAPVERRAGDFAAEAHGALEQGADDPGVGYNAALAHRVGEVGVGGAIQFWMVRRVRPKKSAKTSLVAPTRQ